SKCEMASMDDLAPACRLVTALVHDIRTPLHAMMLKLTMMELRLAQRLDDEGRAEIESLQSDILTIIDLLTGILNHGQRPDGHTVADDTEFGLDDVLSGCAQVVQPL